jgi:hypothetical protein
MAMCVAALLSGPSSAAAQEMTGPREPLPDHFAGVAAVGSAVRLEGAWDRAFGAEVGIGRLGEERGLSMWALSGGVLGFSRRSGGRAWTEGMIGTRWPAGIPLGLGAGPAVELDDLRRPRWGGQVTLWALAGVMPYLRLGAVQQGGAFVDLGVRIAFPVVRW